LLPLFVKTRCRGGWHTKSRYLLKTVANATIVGTPAVVAPRRSGDEPDAASRIQQRPDDGVAPDGHHAVVVLVPIALGLDDDPAVRDRLRDQVLADLRENVGVDLRDRIVVEESACVSEFAACYGNP